MRFRPCIDLHAGKVKQIVGSTLNDDPGTGPITNFETEAPAADFARRYQADNLTGGHVIMLGPGNESAARSALAAWPNGLQIGGGITPDNAAFYLDAGASHVIVTSWVFRDGRIEWDRLDKLCRSVGRNHLVLDLSCTLVNGKYIVVTDRWQKQTEVTLDAHTFGRMSAYCDEFLVHAADVEGKQQGVDANCISLLADCCPLPVTYAGGVAGIEDLRIVYEAGGGNVDVTVGSALDIFGGKLPYRSVVDWCKKHESA